MNHPLFARLRSFVRNATCKEQIDRELTEEISAYVELLAHEKIKQDISENEARRASRVEVGGAEQVKEEVRPNSQRVNPAIALRYE